MGMHRLTGMHRKQHVSEKTLHTARRHTPQSPPSSTVRNDSPTYACPASMPRRPLFSPRASRGSVRPQSCLTKVHRTKRKTPRTDTAISEMFNRKSF